MGYQSLAVTHRKRKFEISCTNMKSKTFFSLSILPEIFFARQRKVREQILIEREESFVFDQLAMPTLVKVARSVQISDKSYSF